MGNLKVKGLTRILPLKICNSQSRSPDSSSRSGFSLIEIIIVIVIVSLMLFVVIPSTQRIFQTEVRSTVRKLSSIGKGIYNDAILTKRLYRLVIDLENQKYWVESSLTESAIVTEEDEPASSSKKSEKTEYQAFQESFAKVQERTLTEVSLPSGVIIKDVVNLTISEDPVRSGASYIYFYPFGETDPALIHLAEDRTEGTNYTIEFLPISGTTRLYSGYTGFRGEEMKEPETDAVQ